MLLIGNGCFGELSLLLCVIMVCVFFLILYIIILLPGLTALVFPVSITLIIYYLTYMYNYSRFVIQPDDGPGIGPKHVVVYLPIISQ